MKQILLKIPQGFNPFCTGFRTNGFSFLFSFPFPVILWSLISLFPTTSYSSTFMENYLISTNSSATGSLYGDITRFNLCSKCFSFPYIRFPGSQSRAYSFPKVCMWEIDPATRDCRPIWKIDWDIVLNKTC